MNSLKIDFSVDCVNYPPTAKPMGWASGVYSRTLDAS